MAIKQEETEFESGFMPDPHHVAGRPEIVSSLGYSADTRSPSLYAADAYIASRQQGTTAGLNGLLHGDSGISASSQILLDMGVRPRNSTPTSRRDEPLKVPSPSAHAELHAPMTQGLKRRGVTARQPCAAAGQPLMSKDIKKKRRGKRAALASLQSPAAEPRGRKRKGELWEDNLEDAAAVMAGLDDVLFELGDDMDIDGGLADLTAADMPAAAAGNAPHMRSSASAALQPASTAQLMQSAAAAPPAFTAYSRNSRSPAVQRDVHAAAVAGGARQQKSQRHGTAAVASGARQQKIKGQGTAARAASGGPLSTAKQPAMPSISNVMPNARLGVPCADQSAASATPPAAASHIGQGPAAAAQTGPAVTLPGRGQAMTRVARHVREACLKKTWEYEESEVVWAQSRGHPWWPAMVSQHHTCRHCLCL